MEFSEKFLDVAFRAIMLSSARTDKELRAFEIICDVCAKHGVSPRIYMAVLNEISETMKSEELNE